MSNASHTRHPLLPRTVTAGLLALVGLAPGCGGKPLLGPSPPLQSLAPPVVTALSESLGSTGGGAEVKIEGTGFLDLEGGPVVIFGGVRASRVSFMGTTTIFATVPAHAAGRVDLVVSNPDGQSGRLANAYTYASPDSFDSNGEWEGTSQTDGFRLRFRFFIQNSKVTAVSCDTSGTVSLSPAPSVSNGEFAFSGDDGVAITGRLVSPRDAIGTINLAPCPNSDWSARKQQ
ncbi:MAG: IPT/TIG domain-containing protein [Acidobacteriota bacterium]